MKKEDKNNTKKNVQEHDGTLAQSSVYYTVWQSDVRRFPQMITCASAASPALSIPGYAPFCQTKTKM